MRKEADWYPTVYQGLFRKPIFPAFPAYLESDSNIGSHLFDIENVENPFTELMMKNGWRPTRK